MTGSTFAVTGVDGFIGKNLALRLRERGDTVHGLTRVSDDGDWSRAIGAADAIIHLAGVNRPLDAAGFAGNGDAAERLAKAVERVGRVIPIILASSSRAGENTPYGRSKRTAEDRLSACAQATGLPLATYRLPNVFGKWCRPNYNSAVATFCHNVARDLPIRIDDPQAPLSLVYVEDVIDEWLALLGRGAFATDMRHVEPMYSTTAGAVAAAVSGFRDDRRQNRIDNVGTGLTRALYATYVSYLPTDDFSYEIESHRDPRGAFSEMLKTRDAGQFSYFTALPGVTRGGHYHHTKTEKFLIVHGQARFRFRHMLTGETHEVLTSGDVPRVVETIPGWAHDVTNTGDGPLVSLLWANEVFDRDRPDTIASGV